MLMTSQPALANHFDSARVEKRGPWMTTIVPRSCVVIPRERSASIAIGRSCGQYGSAKATCVVIGPS
jgi:hypothetical protein